MANIRTLYLNHLKNCDQCARSLGRDTFKCSIGLRLKQAFFEISKIRQENTLEKIRIKYGTNTGRS